MFCASTPAFSAGVVRERNMNREQKTAVVEEIAAQIQAAHAIFAVDYRGLSVSQAAQLRGRLRESDTRFRIVKNSLTERAADKAGIDSLKPMLEGPTALALVGGDAAVAAKALSEVARMFGILDFKGGLMDGAALSADDVRAISRLPARDVLHAQLVGAVASPVTGLVRTLNALISGLAVQLKAIADQGLVSGGSPEPPAEAEGAAEPEPAAEAEPATEAEPAAEAEAEPAAEAEPRAEAEPAAEAEPPAEAEPAAEAEPPAEADPAAEAEPTAPGGEPEAPAGPAETPAETPAESGPESPTEEPDESEPGAGNASEEKGGTE
jgi:large subunit ribosomal protein L10